MRVKILFISELRMTKMYARRYRGDIFVILYRITSVGIRLVSLDLKIWDPA